MNIITKIFITGQIKHLVKVSSRNYPRWPSKTLLKTKLSDKHQTNEPENEMLDTNERPIQEDMKIKWRHQVNADASTLEGTEIIEREKKRKPKKAQKAKNTDMLETVFNENGQFIFTKMKNHDTRISTLLTTVKAKKSLLKNNLILLEGKRLIKDALLAGCALKYLIFSRKAEIDYIKEDLPKFGAKIYKMPYKEMQMWSDLTTTPGIMGLFSKPNTDNYLSNSQVPITIYCDNVREPGNLGAILRVAASAGCQEVMLSDGCTGLWETKVTRSSAGSHFRVKISTNNSLDDLQNILNDKNREIQLFIADNKLTNFENSKGLEDVESVINQIPIIPYYAVDVKEANKGGKEIVIIIGGETQGLNADIYQLAKHFNGVRLNIPMANGVDSLNTGTALGIIIFEFYRQFITRRKLVENCD